MTQPRDLEEKMLDDSNEFAASLVDELAEDLPEELDFGTVMFALFIDAIHVLLHCGWTKEDLLQEVHVHEALETTEGGIQ